MTQDMNHTIVNGLRAVLMGALMFVTGTNAMAQESSETPTGVVVHGNVYGGGNQAGVLVNTAVNMSTGKVEGNVYGGGNVGDVGTHVDQATPSVGNYAWKDQDGNDITNNTAENKLTGFSKVTITGGTVGVENPAKPKEHGNVFGGGKGEATTFECEKGMVYKTNVSIKKSGTTNTLVYRNVYGGGEVSRVENDTEVTIGTASGEDEPTIKGSVFAAGAGVETHGYSALVRGHSTITVQGKATVEHNVYGGGELASVGRYKVKTPANANDSDVPKSLPYGMPAHLIDGGKSTVVIQDNATIGSTANTGHVYGAGKGLDPRLDYDYASGVDGENDYHIDEHKPKRMVSGNAWEHFTSNDAYLQFVETLALSAETDVTINGSNVTVKGSVFGGSESGFVYHNTDVEIQAGTIEGDAFGGGRGLESFAEAGRVRGNTKLTVSGGAVEGNVYGGGNLGDVGTIDKSDPDYNYEWKNSEANGNIFTPFLDNTAHNNEITDNNTNTGICEVIISGGRIGSTTAGGHVFGAGQGKAITWWCEKAIVYATNVTVSGGEIHGNVYGGGQVGRVEDDAKVVIGVADATGAATPTISGSVFGAGAGLHTHGYSALVRGNSDVTVQGTAQIGGSVYGGGQIASVGKFHVVGGLPSKPKSGGTCIVNIKDNAHIGTSGTDHNVFGACKGVDPATVTDRKSMQLYQNRPKQIDSEGNIEINQDTGKEVLEGESWDYYEDHRFVWVYYSKDDYPDFLKTLALTSNPHVTISENATVYGDVYGGGERGVTLGKVEVDITGGTVTQDVYGGGSLADTNTANWEGNALVSSYPYHEETMITRPGYQKKNVPVGESVEGLYTKSGNDYNPANDVAVQGTDYYKPFQGASVTGLYTRTGSEGNYTYTKITGVNATADASTTYYALYTTTVNLLGGTICGNAYGGGLGRFASNTESLVEAKVYGETKVNLNGMTVGEKSAAPTSIQNLLATTAIDGNGDNDRTDTDDDYYTVSSKGCIVNQIFGCNNLKGSPQGNVTVHVFATQNKDASKTTVGAHFTSDKEIDETLKNASATVEELKAILADQIAVAKKISVTTTTYETLYNDEEATVDQLKENIPKLTKAINDAADTDAEKATINALRYDMEAVYGGGNESPYVPVYNAATGATDFKTQVIIEGCEYTSIETVYGGGNAASVPETNVTIKAAYEIETVFGGGNGNEPTDHFNPNPGADIGTYKNASDVDVTYGTGNANTTITGGYIHEAYGGSNERGTIMGTVNLTSNAGTACDMLVKKMVTAGKNADIMGDAITILGCMPDSWVEEYYGGADNANVHGNVELTITSGNFRKVFGGNNKSGIIMGHIKVNIEETGCIPINIDELYLGGNEAAYSTYGYYLEKNNNDEPVLTGGKLTFKPRESETDTHLAVTSFTGTTYTEKAKEEGVEYKFKYDVQPELNVISCTRIGEVFGGGLGETAIVYGNPTVNINMEPGAWANQIDRVAPSGADNNANALGEIGNVYGGGDAAAVYGNTTVNIGTATKVQMTSMKDNDGNLLVSQPEHDVTGAYITGNVYGGGKLADVGAYDEVYDEATDRTNNVINVSGNTNVNICAKLNSSGEWESVAEGTSGVLISGNVYGGGKGANTTDATAIDFYCKDAMVLGNKDDSDGGTFVHIGNGTVNGNVYGGGEISRVEQNTAVWIGLGEGSATTPTSTPDIKGTVFGAGAGLRTHRYSALVRGHSSVTIEGNALIEQSVYGGGEMATVGRYNVVNNVAESNISGGACTVVIGGYAEIGPNDMVMNNTTTGKPDDYGHVFGAGKGIQPYEGFDDDDKPWSKISNGQTEYTEFNEIGSTLPETYATYIRTLALATETDVTIKDHAFVKGSVYGGSENGFVQEDTHVTIQDDCQIGNGYVQMDDEGTYLGTKRSVNRRYTAKEWEKGHLFVTGDPVYYNTEGETPVLNTLTDEETALRNAVGDNYTSSLPECASWPYGRAADEADRYAPYDKDALSTGYYDAGGTNTTAGGRSVGDDGHTFYGNVFGGGSGYYPYKPGRWFKDAGAVYGDTYVTIKGGHILTNVYGGNEMTDVGKYDDNDRLKLISGGNCYVTMIGGTLGVPRTLGQIDKHPVTCYLFGAGKGDQRVFFNKSTNVGNVFVHISDEARIYGSVFGGGEDGHVMKNVTMNIGGGNSTLSTAVAGMFNGVTLSGSKEESKVIYPYIGSYGTSYVDGNVFGAGRGFGGDAYTAGNVAGTVTMNIYGGTMLGSIYGGGRLGSVGYGLFDAKTSTGVDMPGYGEMRLDNTMESQTGTSSSTSEAFPRGYVYMTIGNDDGTGPIIGNKWEYIVPSASSGPKDNGQPTLPADIKNWTEENWMTWKEHNYIPKTEFDTTTGQLTHTKGGNVFAGGMGRFYQLDGHTPISAVDWWKLGNVKSTKLTITGGTIKSNVYGGGELGMVQGGSHTSEDNKSVSTEIIINGGTIGTEVTEKVNNVDVTQYTFGNVFGGGYGSLLEKLTHTSSVTYPKYIAGRVKGSTEVTMTSGAVKASVYGGGEMAAVGESKVLSTSTDPVVLGETLTGYNGAPIVANTYVTISGGTIGKEKVGTTYFGGAKMGNVYGGGSGHNNTVRSGHIYGNTNVTITGESTHIYHNVYGGGAYGTVGDFTYTTRTESGVQKVSGITDLPTERTNTGTANVTITGGIIGYDGKENGMVFGSSRGDINQPGERDDYTAWVYDANVTIGTAATPAQGNEGEEGYVPATDASGPEIKGSVYGSGENGHTFNNTVVTVNGGTIGIASTGAAYNIVVPDPDFPNDRTKDKTYSGAAYPYRGNVYGGGCGTDKYYSDHSLENHSGGGDSFNDLAGIVYGNATVNINGGTVVRNVYGAGAMGSVGRTITTTDNDVTTTTVSGGTTTINVSGGTIGVDGTDGVGNVFGAARGDEDAIINEAALVRKNTSVSVTGGTIKGNVYGGGELGCVGTFTVSDDMRTFTWKNTDGTNNTDDNSDNKNTGICNVTVNGSSAVINGHVYGAGKGKEDTFWCEKGIAYSTNVNISNGTVNGNVYGGGEVGRVETDSQVKIGLAPEEEGGKSEPSINGSVFGGGAGVETHGYSALVRGNTTVTVDQKAHVAHSIYGGGEIASVGRYALDAQKMPSILQGGGYCYVTVQGHATIGDDVFGAGKGNTPHFDNTSSDLSKRSRRMTLKSDWESRVGADRFDWDYLESESDYSTYLETLALATRPEVTIGGNAAVSGSVFGGGELGLTKGSVIVNIQGGTIAEDVYGGGSLANTNTTSSVDTTGDGQADTTVDPTTTVNLKGGTINCNVYGGGLGQLAKNAVNYTQPEADAYNTEHHLQEGDEGYVTTASVKEPALSDIAAKVYGDVFVKLNETTATDNCVVKGKIFGCNNLNGSPQSAVTVHIYRTADYTGHEKDQAKSNTKYNVEAVYGGGNLAAYYPDDPTSRASAVANVIIDGCGLTSIGTVYGGGNAASVPATEVTVYGTYEIGQVFGGGNGADDYQLDGKWYDNPGANVGLQSYAYFVKEGETGYSAATHGSGTEDDPYKVFEYTSADGTSKDASDKDKRETNYGYGIGKTHVTIYRGTVHEVYGGSNSRGNVREEARTTLEDLSTMPEDRDCLFDVGEAYGGGRNAPMDGDAILEIGCISGLDKAYGGAANADVNGNVVLNITNGTYDQVFGGNDLGGLIRGSITVNIEETGCNPVIIGELYGGGNRACYSVYGYNEDGSVKETGDNPVADPVVNVKSFTGIGTVYGGGYGAPATMVGNPEVNINVVKGKYSGQTSETYFTNKGFVLDPNDNKRYSKTVDNDGSLNSIPHTVYVPTHEVGAIGAIYNVFGGGNAAKVIGTPHVNIGSLTGEPITLVTKPIEDSEGRTPSQEGWIPSYELVTVEGVDIRGNVYGAGNNADVTGDTKVVIGKNNAVKTYSFTSYDAEDGGTAWSSGLAQTTGVTKNGLAEVEILTNGKYREFVGKNYYVDSTIKTDGSEIKQLIDDKNQETGVWVAVKPFENKKTYGFKSYGAASGGTPYSEGTAAPTGNFKNFGGTDYMQIVVLTNPGETSWVGKTFYVPVDASTDGTTRTQLYDADGSPVGVWVTIK